KHVMSLLNQMRNGKDNDPRFGSRQTGEGVYAELLAKRFMTACSRLGLNRGERYSLDTKQFVPPVIEGTQLSLW
ncbi:MAG: radical SAM protein, partial [Steroidobacter sp.]